MIFRTFKIVFISLLFISNFSCEKVDDINIVNLNGNHIGIIGHGGIGFTSATNLVPDNSLRSIRRAINGYGVEGVEVDVQMSLDYELFLYHDLDLQSKTNCQGAISERLSTDLDQCNYRNHIVTRFIDELYLPRLENVINEFSTYTIKPLFFLDMRTTLNSDPMVADILNKKLSNGVSNLIDKYNGYNWIFVESGNLNFLNEVRVENRRIQLLFDGDITVENIEKMLLLDIKGIVSRNATISKEKVTYAHSKGLQVSVFDLKSRSSHINAIKNNVDFIQTDNIELLINILNGI
jgi:glycerophosphoryl diester phosphodiesterase